jgi:hypothetical protein
MEWITIFAEVDEEVFTLSVPLRWLAKTPQSYDVVERGSQSDLGAEMILGKGVLAHSMDLYELFSSVNMVYSLVDDGYLKEDLAILAFYPEGG